MVQFQCGNRVGFQGEIRRGFKRGNRVGFKGECGEESLDLHTKTQKTR